MGLMVGTRNTSKMAETKLLIVSGARLKRSAIFVLLAHVWCGTLRAIRILKLLFDKFVNSHILWVFLAEINKLTFNDHSDPSWRSHSGE